MTVEEFEKEVRNSALYYPEFESEYEDFKQYQRLALSTLNEFHRICEKAKINYTLAYGSLLGAIRDKGQIPWDYDIDVIVSIQDRERLVKALEQELCEDFYFMSPEVDSKCRHYFIKLCPRGYRSLELHVDVFFLVGVPEDEAAYLSSVKTMEKLTKIRRIKLRSLKRVWKLSHREFFICVYRRVRFLFTPLKIVDKQYYELTHRYPLDKSQFCAVPGYLSRYNTNEILSTKCIALSSGEYRITENYEPLLNKWYGDYHQIMPLEERLNEMRVHCSHLRRFAKE